MFVCKRSKHFEIMICVLSIVIKYGYPRSRRTAETCEKQFFYRLGFQILTSKSIISLHVTVVIETTLYINYVLSIQSVLDIINPVVMPVYE